MATHNPIDTASAIRHRFKEITLHPAKSKHPIELEILVDNKSVHKFPPIEVGRALRWDTQTYPCDAHVGSTIGLKFIEKHRTSPDRDLLVEYTISDSTNQVPITKCVNAFGSRPAVFGFLSRKSTAGSQSLEVTATFPDITKISNDYAVSLAKAKKMIEGPQGPLDRLGNSRLVLKTILEFAGVAAELHPTAKLVIGLCMKAWEHLESIQGQYDDLQRLIDGLDRIRPFIESAKGRAKEDALRHTILKLLHLIEDTSNFVINYRPRTDAAQTMRALFDSKPSDRINELLQKFERLKESFVTGVVVHVLNQVLTNTQRALLDRLKPAAGSHYSGTPPCQDGTRSEVLDDIYAWCEDSITTSKLLWLHGQAGMGKSTIASSVCRRLNDQGTLGAPFFCKRDDPQLRTPEQILNTLVYTLASRYQSYGQSVADAIENDVQLPDSPFEQRYTHLVVRPLQTLHTNGTTMPQPLIVVVDALDECEQGGNRRLLLTYLREMSLLVPWLKVVITSRPDPDIRKAFEDSIHGEVLSRELIDYDATGDVLHFTRARMTGIAKDKDLPEWPEDSIQQLSTRAGGLFIWVETACKFVEKGLDPGRRLSQILDGTQPAEGSQSLDQLYTTAIRQSMGDGGNDNIQSCRECIGAIVATAGRTPLSVVSLASLLSGHIGAGVIRTVVNRLGSVLYEDHSHGGAVRVYHPSFADFILDSARSGSFYTDPKVQNTVLTECCLNTMMRELRFNNCGLKTSHLLNRNVPDLESRVQTAIGGHIAYGCMHWISHTIQTPEGTNQDQLGQFLFSPKLLFWLEAMSLLKQLGAALTSLLEFVAWTSGVMESESSYANDAYRFALTFHDAISDSAPHLYISALAFAPIRSKLGQEMRSLFAKTFMVTAGTNESWAGWLQSMSHSGGVYSMACSVDGHRIVSGSGGGIVRIWDSETGAAVSEPLESPGVSSVAITSDGRHIASGSDEGTLRVWNAETGAALGKPFGGQPGSLISIAFSPDNHQIFSSHENGTVYFWDVESGTKISELHLEHALDVLSTTLSPDGRHIASSTNTTLRVWNAETGAPVTEPLAGHTDEVRCVAFSPKGHLLASGSDDETVRIWDTNSAQPMRHLLIGHSSLVLSVAFCPNGRFLVSGSLDKTVRVWDVETGMPVGEPLVGHSDFVRSVAFCSNDRRIVSASVDKTVRIWDMGVDFTASTTPLGHSAAVNSVSFSADGRYLASGSDDGTVRIWDAHTGAEAFKPLLSGAVRILSALFTPDSRHIISLVSDNTVQIWDVETGVLGSEFPLDHSGDILSISLLLDGRLIASGSEDGTVGLWDADTGAAVFPPLAAHSDWVQSVSLSPDGRFIASGSDDCTVRIWDAETGAAVGEPLTGHSNYVASVCFSPDSRRIASGSWDNTVRVWDVPTGAALLEPMRGHSIWVRSVVFSPDGRYIISGSSDETVRIWDADTGAPVAKPLVGHSDYVVSVAVSPDGRHIASGSSDQSVRFWDAETAFADPEPLTAALHSAPSTLSLSTGFLARYTNESGWVTSSDGALLLWLPKDRRHIDDSIINRSANPTLPRDLVLDFSQFVHGDSWASVFGG